MYQYGGAGAPPHGAERVTSGMGQSGLNLWDEELDMLFVENASAADMQQQAQLMARQGVVPPPYGAGVDMQQQQHHSMPIQVQRRAPNARHHPPASRSQEIAPYVLPTEVTSMGGASDSGDERTNRGKTSATTGDDKKAKRRAAVAAASRATRAKRKRELEDLRDTNRRLEKERERFLDMIAELQMKVQALRETGSIDLRMENDLLRAELTEHKQFISQFKRIADGIPTSKTAKRVMCKQGADTAIAQVLGLASTSSIDTTWRVGKIPDYPNIQVRYQRLPYGTSALQAKRTSVRFDTPFIPMEPAKLAEIIWSLWVDQDKMERINKHFGISDMSVREIDTGLNDTMMSQAQNCDLIKLFYFRETRPIKRILDDGTKPDADCPRVTMDTVEVCARKECQVSASSFMNAGEVTTLDTATSTVSATTNKHGAENATSNTDGSKRAKTEPGEGSTASDLPIATATGTVSAIVLANTSTQHGAEIEPEKPGIHRIRAAVLEGAIVRPVEGGCSWTSIISHPSREADMEAGHLIIDANGNVTPAWVNSVHEIHAIVLENVSRSLLEQYVTTTKIPAQTQKKWKELLAAHQERAKQPR